MRARRDGQATRQRILAAALEVFGERGFHDATHAEICALARAHASAVNYHFQSKDGLYRATWEYAADLVESLYPLDGGLPVTAPAVSRLRAQIHALVHRAIDPRMGHFHNLRLMELAHPTGFLAEDMLRRLERHRRHTVGVLRELLGPAATAEDLRLCELSIVSQCRAVRLSPDNGHHPPAEGRPSGFWRFHPEDADRLIDHISHFCLAGIDAMRARLEAGSSVAEPAEGMPGV